MSISSLNWQAAHAWLLAHEGYWVLGTVALFVVGLVLLGNGQGLVPAVRRITCNRMAIDAFLSG